MTPFVVAIIFNCGHAQVDTYPRQQLRTHNHDALPRDFNTRCGLTQIQVVVYRFGNEGIEAGIVEGFEPVIGDVFGAGG